MICSASPAAAQLAGSISVDSDQRFRGFSLSDGRPTATLAASYDDQSGLYANADVMAVDRRHDGVGLLGYQVNGGFARRLSGILSVDGGIVRSEISYPYHGRTVWDRYTEAYVGATLRNISARVSYSPHYYRSGFSTIYAELEGGFRPADNWRVSAHVGALGYLSAPYYASNAARYDWRVSVSRQIGQLELHSALSGGGPHRYDLYGFRHSGTALTFGASFNL